MRLAPILVAILLNAAVTSRACADPAVDGGAQTSYKKLPWHLVDVYWDFPADLPFESYSVDVTLSADISPSVNLYIAPIGLGVLSGTKFYGGMQTQVDGNTKHDPKLRKIGRGFLFSMWGERGYDAIRPADGGYCQSSGHEGDFVSVRRPYEWKAGVYTYRLVKMDAEQLGGKHYTWVGAFVEDHQSSENIFVGALRFPGRELKLQKNNLANFIEIYGSRIVPDDELPALEITFGNVRVNAQPVINPRITAVYPKGVPDYADARVEDNAVIITVGKRVESRTTRSVVLLSP
jgi:hypothetical protein